MKLISRSGLISIKRKALRRRVWFLVLDRAERALIDLTIRVVDTVKSSRLARVLSNPIGKLRKAMKSVVERAREMGHPLVERLAKIAHSWGNTESESWVKDETFAEYVGLSAMNKSINGCF